MRANDPAANDAMGGSVEQELCESFVATVGDSAAGSRPRKDGLADLDAFGLALILRLTRPSDFGVGIGDGRYLPRVEIRFLAMRDFGGQTLHYFAIALTIGILFGIYSSVFVAAAIAMWLGVKREDLVKSAAKDHDPNDPNAGAVV